MADEKAQYRAQFEGNWRLISFELRTSNGITYPYGKDAAGIISYSNNGLMSVQIMRRRESAAPSFSFNPDDEPLYEEEAAINQLTSLTEVFESYLAYYGAYKVDESAKTVTHYVEGSNRPAFMNRRLLRAFEFDGDLLRLSPPSPESTQTNLVWKRIPAKT